VTFSLNVGNFYLLDVFNITTETSSTLQAECYTSTASSQITYTVLVQTLNTAQPITVHPLQQ